LTNFVGPSLDTILSKKRNEFDQKFEETFLTKLSTIKDPDRAGLASFAAAVFSNLIGGIGYLYFYLESELELTLLQMTATSMETLRSRAIMKLDGRSLRIEHSTRKRR